MSDVTKQPSIEPVPDGSELLALPFLSAIAGLFESGSSKKYRVTLHRAMTRGDKKYLQQIAPYAERSGAITTGAGRIFDSDKQLIGRAFMGGKVCRTKHYNALEAFETALADDMCATRDNRPVSEAARSWLVIPFVVPNGPPALLLFAESWEFNFFADDTLVACMVGMCRGYARMLDALQRSPAGSVRNFPIASAINSVGKEPAYPTIHEELNSPVAPQFENIKSFNFEIIGP